MAWNLECLANLGDFLGGVATFVGVGFAIYEVVRRNVAARNEKRSVAAAQALIAITRAVDAATRWDAALEERFDFRLPPEGEPSDEDRLDAACHSARERTLQCLSALHDALTTAQVQLSADELKGLRYVHDLVHELRDNFDDAASVLGSHDLVSDPNIRSTFREGVRLCQEQLEESAPVLQRIAQLKS